MPVSGNNMPDPLERRLKAVRRRKSALALVRGLLITAAVSYLLFGVIFGLSIVKGSSMAPALENGDLVLFFRLQHSYRKGDIVLASMGQRDFIKRVEALPGQTVGISTDGQSLTIDGMETAEPYIYGNTVPKAGCKLPVRLGKDEYFLLGDNRENSVDSRNYGPVEGHRLDGVVIAVLRL